MSFAVSYHVSLRQKPVCTVTVVSKGSDTQSSGAMCLKQRTTKGKIRLLGCAGFYAHLLFTQVMTASLYALAFRH